MSPGRDELQILIVGRTIEGLALAGYLRQADFEPIILETPTRQARTRLCTLPPDTMELFAQLGIADHLRESGWLIRQWTVHRPTGDRTRRLPPDTPAPVALPRAVIRDRLERPIPDASIREGSRVDSLSTEDAIIHVGFEDGIEESFDLIVGADGPCSVVRSQLTDSSVIQRERTALSVAATTERSAAGVTEVYDGDSLVISVNTGERTRIQVSSNRPENTTSERPPNSLLSRYIPERFGDITVHSHDWLHATYYAGQTWTAGRGVLLGSAAAAFPPFAGIGLPFAIGDARTFARTLLTEPGSLDTKLQAYANARQQARADIDDRIPAPHAPPSRPNDQAKPPDLRAYRRLFRAACFDPQGCARPQPEYQE